MPERDLDPVFSTWLSAMDPLAVYALAVGSVMAVLAVGLWLASYRADRTALRLFSIRYAAAAPGWIFGHPQAHGPHDAAPFVPMVIAVVLLALTGWALDEFLGTSNRRRLAAIGALGLAAIALLAVLQWVQPGSPLGIYMVIGATMAACAAMAWRASRRERHVGHEFVAGAFALYPLLLIVVLPFGLRLSMDLGYLVALPSIIVGVTVLVVSLMRAQRRTEHELSRREAAENELRQLNTTLERRVEQRTEALQAMVDALESFTRSVSHDLRGSLSGIAGMLRFADRAMQDGDLPRARRLIAPLPAELDHLTMLVRNLLELSRVGEVELRPLNQPAGQAAERALDSLRLAPETAALLRRVSVDVQPLPTVAADPSLLQQVFVNLIGNALRFAGSRPDGRVTVGSSARDDGVAIFVADNGPGFDPALAGELFTPFRRLHASGLSRHGIGLSIVRRIVERHGGRVWAESVSGNGASFWLNLPGSTRLGGRSG